MKIMALICKMLILFLTHFIMSLFSICNGNLFKREKKGYGECEIVLIVGGNIVSRTSLCLYKLIQTRINVWNNLFLIEYNNIIQINGI